MCLGHDIVISSLINFATFSTQASPGQKQWYPITGLFDWPTLSKGRAVWNVYTEWSQSFKLIRGSLEGIGGEKRKGLGDKQKSWKSWSQPKPNQKQRQNSFIFHSLLT